MGTFSIVSVRHQNLNNIINLLEDRYRIHRKEHHYESLMVYYYDAGNETIIFSKNHNNDWIDIEFDFLNGIYEYDIFLAEVSKILRTEILFGYAQSTSGDVRIAKFVDGASVLSVRQELSPEAPYRIYLSENIGIEGHKHVLPMLPKLGEEITEIMSFEDVWEFFVANGRTYDPDFEHEDNYLHVEKINR